MLGFSGDHSVYGNLKDHNLFQGSLIVTKAGFVIGPPSPPYLECIMPNCPYHAHPSLLARSAACGHVGNQEHQGSDESLSYVF